MKNKYLTKMMANSIQKVNNKQNQSQQAQKIER